MQDIYSSNFLNIFFLIQVCVRKLLNCILEDTIGSISFTDSEIPIVTWWLCQFIEYNCHKIDFFTQKPTLSGILTKLLMVAFRSNLKQAQLYGFAYGFSQSVVFAMYGGAFRFGAWQVSLGEMAPENVYKWDFYDNFILNQPSNIHEQINISK